MLYVPGFIGALTSSMIKPPMIVVNSSPVNVSNPSVAIENVRLLQIVVAMFSLLTV
jgi:hypothetical protein